MFNGYSGHTQPTVFFRTYDLGISKNPVLCNVVSINKNIITTGFIKSPNQKLIILKTDSLTELNSNIIYGEDTGKYYIKGIVIINDTILMQLLEHENTNTYNVKPVLLFFNNTIYYDSICENLFNSHFNKGLKSNDSFYFIGNTRYDNSGNELMYGTNYLFYKTNFFFEEEDKNSIGNTHLSEYCYDGVIGFDSNLLLGGVVLNGNQQDWYLVNVDTSGNVLGEYVFGTPYNDYDGIKSISTTSDSCYLIAGIFNKGFNSSPYYYDLAIQVIKLDRNFNILWQKILGIPLPGSSVSKIIQTKDGNQAILVQRTPSQSTTIKYSQLVKFTNSGNILWWRNYLQGDTTMYVRYRAWDLIETSDSCLVFCGSAIDTIHVGPYQQAWLVKTDSLGCDGLQSCNDTALVVQIINAPDTLCKNQQTSIQVRLKGRSAPYRLYANGSLALSNIYYPYTLPLWIDTIVSVAMPDTGWQPLIITVKDPWNWQQSDSTMVYIKNCGQSIASNSTNSPHIEIYPNPATAEVHVRIRGVLSGEYTITLYNMQGKPVQKTITSNPETTLNISQLPQGVYMIRVLGNNIAKSERVVKSQK
jgi:hypothetical protein